MNINNLINQLKEVQASCTGLFKPRASSKWELVIERDGSMLKTLSIGGLFGLHTLHIEMYQGQYIQFPANKTLSEMMEDPTEFYHWCVENQID